MKNKCCRISLWLGLIILMMTQSSQVFAADFTIDNYTLQSKKRMSRTQYLYTFKARITNNSVEAVGGITATLSTSANSTHTSIADGTLEFGALAAGESVQSETTFSIYHDRRYGFDESNLSWSFEAVEMTLWNLSDNAGTADFDPGWNLTVTSDITEGEEYYYVKNDVAAAIISTKTASNNNSGTFRKGFVADFVNREANYDTLDWTQFQIYPSMHKGWNYTDYQVDLSDIYVDGDRIVASGYWVYNSDIKATVTYTMLEDAPILKIKVVLENQGSSDFSGYLMYQLDPDGSGNQNAYAPGLGWDPDYQTTGWTDTWIYDGTTSTSDYPAHGIAWVTSSPTAINAQGYIINPWFDASVETESSTTIIMYHITDLPSSTGNAYDSIDEWAGNIINLDSDINEVAFLSGTVTDSETGEPVSGATIIAKNTDAELVGTTATDDDGNYSLILDPDVYTLTVKTLGYELTSKSISMETGGESYTMDIAMDEVTVWAGMGKTLSGSLVQGTDEDIIMENSQLAMAVAVVSEDSQLSPTTAGKVLDIAVAGLDDNIDWLNLPYISDDAPSGDEPWNINTAQCDIVEVTELTDTTATVVASGTYTENSNVAVQTTYTITEGEPYILAETVITNNTGNEQSLWVGDVVDVDESGQTSYLPGTGAISSTIAEYEPTEPWIAMYGSLTEQAVGLIYLGDATDFNVFATGNWIMSKQQITMADGGNFTLKRYIVAVPTDDYSVKGEAIADVYANMVGISASMSVDQTAIDPESAVTVSLTVSNNSEEAISDITATLGIDSRMETSDNQSVPLGEVAANSTRTLTWVLTGVSGGNSKVSVNVESVELSATKSAFVFVSGPGWYAGDNHNHSTWSDGSGTIEQNYASAISKGMTFNTSTDHNTISQAADVLKYSTDTFLGITGEETTSYSSSSGGFWGHALSYNIGDELIDWLNTAQQAIDDTVAANDGQGFLYIAHPYYPGLSWASWDVTGYTGLEVWNGFYAPTHSVNIQAFAKWDELNNAGLHKFGIANSDAHNVNKMGDPHIVAYLSEFTRENIIDALRTGRCYGTDGPELIFTVNNAIMGSDLAVNSGSETVTVEIGGRDDSAISSVTLIKNGETLATWSSEETSFSTTYEDIAENGDFYRLVVQTEDGGYAFSNPVWIVEE